MVKEILERLDEDKLVEKIVKMLDRNGGVKISGCDKYATIREIERYSYTATDLDGVDWDLEQDKLETFIENIIDELEDDRCDVELSII